MSRWIKVVMLSVLVMGGLSLRAWADEKHDMSNMPEKKMSAEFTKLKSLVGTWTGKSKMHGDKMENIKVVYSLTGGGSAVLERICPGTPGEMASVYHVEDGKLCMTHYCSLGNAPKMTFKGSTDNSLSFEMKGKDGIASEKETHMHGLTITWKDKNHIAASWLLYQDGKAAPCSTFNLTRKM